MTEYTLHRSRFYVVEVYNKKNYEMFWHINYIKTVLLLIFSKGLNIIICRILLKDVIQNAPKILHVFSFNKYYANSLIELIKI